MKFHLHSDLLQLPLGLLFKNENVNEELIDIVQELHDKYLPVDKKEVEGDEVISILEHLFIGGDQLTDERATARLHAVMAISNLNILRALLAKLKTSMQFVFYISLDEDVTGPI